MIPEPDDSYCHDNAKVRNSINPDLSFLPLRPSRQEKMLKGDLIDSETLEKLATNYTNDNVPGLKWEEIDSATLENGTDFKNEALSAALRDRLEFKESELQEMGVQTLSWDDHVYVDGKARFISHHI